MRNLTNAARSKEVLTPVNIKPVIRDDATARFFDATAEGKFLLRRSGSSGEILTPSAEQDSAGNTDLEWVEASGYGRVVSWAFVPQRAVNPDSRSELTIGLIELDEGPWWWTQIIDARREDMVEGLRVRAVYRKSGHDVADEYVALFVPDRDASAAAGPG